MAPDYAAAAVRLAEAGIAQELLGPSAPALTLWEGPGPKLHAMPGCEGASTARRVTPSSFAATPVSNCDCRGWVETPPGAVLALAADVFASQERLRTGCATWADAFWAHELVSEPSGTPIGYRNVARQALAEVISALRAQALEVSERSRRELDRSLLVRALGAASLECAVSGRSADDLAVWQRAHDEIAGYRQGPATRGMRPRPQWARFEEALDAALARPLRLWAFVDVAAARGPLLRLAVWALSDPVSDDVAVVELPVQAMVGLVGAMPTGSVAVCSSMPSAAIGHDIVRLIERDGDGPLRTLRGTLAVAEALACS